MLSVPPPTRVALGTLEVGGQRLELFLSPEWARYFQSLTTKVQDHASALMENAQHAALMDEGAEAADTLPAPPGPRGEQGAQGFSLFMLQDDAPDQAMLMPPVIDGMFLPLSSKDASGGVPGLTLLKLNLKNAAGTITSWFTTAATAARTWTMPDKDGTVAVLTDFAAPPAIGATTPAAGSFTALNATVPGLAELRAHTTGGASLARMVLQCTTGECGMYVADGSGDLVFYDYLAGAEKARFSGPGLAITGQLATTGKFGCNGKPAQAAAASGGTLAGVIAALVANGILSS